MKARLLSIALALCMALSLTPVAYAADEDVAPEARTVTVSDEQSLRDAIANAQDGDVVQLGEDIYVTPTDEVSEHLIPYFTITKDITFDLNSHKVEWKEGSTGGNIPHYLVVFCVSGANVVVTGNGTVDVEAGGNSAYGFNVMNDGNLVIENGTFTGAPTAVQVQKGSLTVLDGTFKWADTFANADTSFGQYLVNCIDSAYKDGTARIYLKGGLFEYNYVNSIEEGDLSYVAAGYKINENPSNERLYEVTPVEEAGITSVVPVDTEDKTIVTVGGTCSETDAEARLVEIDTTSIDSNESNSVDVSIDEKTAESIEEAKAGMVIKTDIGTVLVNAEAVKSMLQNAKETTHNLAGGSITIGITRESVSTEERSIIEITAMDLLGNDIFSEGDANGSVTVSMDYSSEAEPFVYYLGSNGAELLESSLDGGILSWSVNHFSRYEVRTSEPVATTAINGVTNTYNNLDDALLAVANGGTVTLLKNANMTKKATIKGDVAIVGNGRAITGAAGDSSVNFTIESGTFEISDVTLQDFGSAAATNSGIAVIKVDSGKTDVKVIANGVNISNFCRSAYDIRSGSFAITGGTIDCGSGSDSGTNSRLTKGIMAGYGSSLVTGAISNVNITNSNSNYDEWSSAGIEIYQNANVTITGGSITNVGNGIHVDNYYDGSADSNAGAVVNIEGVTVVAEDDAIRVYGKGGSASAETPTAIVTVDSGNYTGDIAVIDGATSENSSMGKEIINVSNAHVDGEISNVKGVMSFVDSVLENAGDGAANAEGVTYVNSEVNGVQTSTTPEQGKVALLNGTQYESLQVAVDAARDGDTITLLGNVELDGTGKGDTQGLLSISKDIIINGNGKIISAKTVTWNEAEKKGPSMINVVGGADVTFRDLIIDGGKDTEGSGTKHGLNIYGAGTVKIEDVAIQNNQCYAIVNNGSNVEIDGLETQGNEWGINVDNSSGGQAKLSIVDATIAENSSIVFDKSKDEVDNSIAVIKSGEYQHIIFNDSANAEGSKPNLTIAGGTFATNEFPAESGGYAINIGEYVEEGMTWNPSTGEVGEKPSVTPGGGGGTVTTPSYDVTIAQPENGALSVDPTKAEEGDEVTITVTPDAGFMLDELVVTDADGNAIETTAGENGTYTFTMPKGKVSIAATFVCDGGELCPTDKFTDVDQSQWYHFAVDWAAENGVMNGIGGTTLFAPDDDLLREQAAAVMWNVLGEGDADAPAAALSDVLQGEWYSPAVNWAVETGAMKGYGGTDLFGMGDSLTREQFAAVVANVTNADLSTVDASVLDDFNDPESVSDWATSVMAWAVEAGVLNGVALPDGSFDLQGDREISRAEMAAMVMNAVNEGVLELRA